MPGDFDFAEVIEQAQASVMARAEREAAAAGVTVDELWERQRIADVALHADGAVTGEAEGLRAAAL